jgi:type IV pilus assembly protein PilC
VSADKAEKPPKEAKTPKVAKAPKVKKPPREKKVRPKPLEKFSFSAMDEAGKKVTGTETATSSGALHVALLERGLQPVEVIKKRNILKFEITKKRVPRKEVMNFSRQLAVFMKAGIPIMEALEVIVEETQGKMLKEVLNDMVERLHNGDTFAAAAAAHPEAFPNYYVGILESAELTGNLDIVLNQLADYMDRDGQARSKITSALIYPSVVAGMSVFTVGILAIFVLPKFVVFFKSLNAKLPLPTRLMINFSSFFGKWWYVLLAIVIAVAAGFIAMRRSDSGRARLDAIMLKLPVIGDLTQTAILERVCRILASLLRAGVDMPRSMTVTAESANNAVYRRDLLTP